MDKYSYLVPSFTFIFNPQCQSCTRMFDYLALVGNRLFNTVNESVKIKSTRKFNFNAVNSEIIFWFAAKLFNLQPKDFNA